MHIIWVSVLVSTYTVLSYCLGAYKSNVKCIIKRYFEVSFQFIGTTEQNGYNKKFKLNKYNVFIEDIITHK